MEKVTFKNRHLLSFLKEKGALDAFIANYKKQYITKTEISDPKADIDNVLIWRGTHEGFTYWSDLHDQWLKSEQCNAHRRKYPSVCGYEFRKEEKGFSLGCQRFKYSDLVKVAKGMSENPEHMTVNISGYRSVVIINHRARLNAHSINVNDVNVLLSMYKLKQINVE